ncbi:MAG TPA: hypothetical protein VD908_12385 [Cytophagales bacterium]|nr:hypothetical protein [Cytophagales bacterium]
MYKHIVVIFLCILTFSSVAQEENEEFEYTREFTYGFNFNTNGGLLGGVAIKHSRALNKKSYQSFGLEVVNVKHEKEVRSQSGTGNFFIFGKQNYLYSIRLQYGREIILFRKAPEEGVQINGILAAGPTIGLLAPYYIRYGFTSDDVRVVKYDPQETPDKIKTYGTGGILQGLDESQVKIGLNLKAALSFEFGTFKSSVAGFEAGFLVEGFPEKINLMPTAEKRAVFTSAFFTLYYGKRR